MIDQSPSGPHSATKLSSQRRGWLWAVFAFLSLSLCSLVAVILAVSGGQLPDLGGEPSWTPPASQVAGQAPANRPPTAGLAAGDRVVNASSGQVRLRRTPGFQNKPADDIIANVPPSAQGEVIDGPQEVDGLRWWRVRFADQEGWMAERSSQGILLLDRAG